MSISVSCDNTLDPLNEERGIYSIFGFVDINEEVNYIRVKDLNIPLVRDTTDFIDATVTFSNLDNGNSETLQDQVITYDSVKTHNFRTTLPILPVTTYKVAVERSDGRTISATATTPQIAEHNVTPAYRNCETPITISFKPVKRENFILIVFQFFLKNPNLNTFQEKFYARVLSPPSSGEYDGEVSFTISPIQLIKNIRITPTLDISSSLKKIDLTQDFNPCAYLKEGTFTINYTHFGPEYELDSELSNVSDSLAIPEGSGSFIGLLRDSFSFQIDTTAVE